MTQLFTNDANALLTAPVAPGDLTFTIEASKADKFPVANTGTDPVGTVGKDWFKAALENLAGEIEYVHVRTRTLASGICSNVIRAREGSTALAFAAGSVCELRVVADDIQDAIDLSANAINRNGDTISSVLNVPLVTTGSNTAQVVSSAYVKQEIAAIPDAAAGTRGLALLASNAEALAGTENSKIMTALRVAQSIAQRVVAATTSLAGIAPIATNTQMTTGTDDASIVTPLKLRLGFSLTLGSTGHISFPTWLGGLMLQWGTTVVHAGSGSVGTTFFSTAFNTTCASLVLTDASTTSVNAVVWAVDTLNLGSFTSYWNASASPPNSINRSARYIALGW